MKPDICIYHAPCADGFTAAWAIWKRWPDIEFYPGVYGAAPPDVTGLDVLIVDFSYKRPVLQQMGGVANSITILDHHKSAQEDLAPFRKQQLGAWPESFVDEGMEGLAGPYPVQALFDMDKSGAMLAWEYAHPGEPAPRLVSYVQDRDLWRFDLSFSREIAAFLFSQEYTFDDWDIVARGLEDEVRFTSMAVQGAAIERKHHKDVAELLKITSREMVIGGERVKVANLPYTMASDAAGLLAEGAAFGACYYDAADGARVFSLRSRAGGQDVSRVAASYGGGGHAAAAGFRAAPGWEGDPA